MWIQKAVAAAGGDVWRSWHMLALWPWPAVIWGVPKSKIDPDDYRCFTGYLRPGDFLLSKSEPFLFSNAAISGTVFKHLAVYTGPVRGEKNRKSCRIDAPRSMGIGYSHVGAVRSEPIFERTVTHAVSEGIICQDLLAVMGHVDYLVAIRPWRTTAQQAELVNRALELVGMGYNFDFSPAGPRELYCTELGTECLSAAKLPVPQPSLKKISLLGKKGPVFLADAFLAAFPAVCCSASCREPNFYRKSRFGDVIRQRLLSAPSSA